MQRHIGIDVHTESCTLAVMGPSGRRITEQVVTTEERTLRKAVKDISGDKWVDHNLLFNDPVLLFADPANATGASRSWPGRRVCPALPSVIS